MIAPDPSPPDRHSSLGLVLEPPDLTETQAQQLPSVRHEQLPQPQPSFQPLFTIVTDGTTRATHHPKVHYIFSDDDPDILTEELARHGYQPSSLPASVTNAPSPPPLSNERALILDLVPKTIDTSESTTPGPGFDVVCVSSLSSSWAVVNVKIGALTEDVKTDAGVTESGSGAGPQLVLRIEGVGDNAVSPGSIPSQKHGARARKYSLDEHDLQMSGSSPSGAAQDKVTDIYGAIVDEFEKRMNVLRKVVDAGMETQKSTQGAHVGDDDMPAGLAAHG